MNLSRRDSGESTGGESTACAREAPRHRHAALCGGLFGCGVDAGERGPVRPDAVQAALTPRVMDRFTHMDELHKDQLEPCLSSYQVERRRLFGLGGILSLLAMVSPANRALDLHATAQRPASPCAGPRPRRPLHSRNRPPRCRGHDPPPILEVEPGDVIAYPETWTHFLNHTDPGVPVCQLAQGRLENPGRSPHSIIGPVGVRGARRGDVWEVRFLSLVPLPWGANFNNPGSLGTGALSAESPEGHVQYIPIDPQRLVARFSPQITLPFGPFQGTFGGAPPRDRDVVGRLSPGVYSSVPPGQHGGNLDLRELVAGSTLYLPVWKDGVKIYTGDSHALQGDGGVNLTALETGMRDVRVQVVLHERPLPSWEWPFAETSTHWSALGIHRDLAEAFRIALHNTLDFLTARVRLSRLDAYGLASLAVSFRIYAGRRHQPRCPCHDPEGHLRPGAL